jgi:hypothetical protein
MDMPPGFLGTDADLLMDLLVTVVPGVLVVMGVSWLQARRQAWTTHRNIQVVLTIVLTVAVTALEVHVAIGGGIEAILGTDDPSTALTVMLNVHLLFAFTAAFTWLGLVGTSLMKFPRPPVPSEFSKTHRRVGWVGMIAMVGTAVTSVGLYLLAFVVGV